MSKLARPPSLPGSTMQRTGPTSSASTISREPGAAIEMGQQHRGPDRRMAGERQFARRREDAQAARGASGSSGGKHEHRFGQIELARDRLHGGGVEPAGSSTTASGLPAKRLRGEDVEREEAAAHGPSQGFGAEDVRSG